MQTVRVKIRHILIDNSTFEQYLSQIKITFLTVNVSNHIREVHQRIQFILLCGLHQNNSLDAYVRFLNKVKINTPLFHRFEMVAL